MGSYLIFVLCKSVSYVPIHLDINCTALSNIHIQGKFASPTDCSESDINNLKHRLILVQSSSLAVRKIELAEICALHC